MLKLCFMKVLQFTIPVSHDKNIIVQKEQLPFFYPHLHRHDEIQLTWVLKGRGTLIAENSMQTFRANEIFWIAGNQPHVFKSDASEDTVESLTLFFNPNGKLATVFELTELKKISTFIHKYPNGFKVPEEYVAELSEMMLRLDQAQGAKQFMSFIHLLSFLQPLQDLIPLVSGSRLSSVNDQEGIRIGAIYDYIMKHYDTDIMLEDIAKHANMTPQAFCRYFKKHTRLTFITFLNEVRIHEACKKLSGSINDNISTIAYQSGFNSIATFNRVFKTITGRAPREYIRELEK